MDFHIKPQDAEGPAPHVTDRTTFSLHIVLLIIVGVIWLIRLSDEVKTQRADLEELKQHVYRHCLEKKHDDPARRVFEPVPKMSDSSD